MISNLQLKIIVGASVSHCTDEELNQIRELLTCLATIEFEVYRENRDKFHAGANAKLLDISHQELEVAA